MTCDPKALLQAAACYRCIPKPVMQSTLISLLCHWANNLTPARRVYWVPNTVGCSWQDSGGLHFGANLADFLANADDPTVTDLRVSDITVTEIGNLDTLPMLSVLTITDCPMTSIDLSGCLSLTFLICNGTGLLSLDVSNHLLLQSVVCDNSRLLTLNCSGCTALTILHGQQCEFGDVTITGCISLVEVWLYDNPQTPGNPPLNVIV